MAMYPFRQQSPQTQQAAFVAPGADLIGDVRLGDGSSVWYRAVLRADLAPIEIGCGSNVQDLCCLHVESGAPCRLGDYVTVGHGAILHACTVEDRCLIGMGAIVLDGAVIGRGSIVGAHALVTKNTVVPPYSLVLGSPAKVVRQLDESTAAANEQHARDYIDLARASAEPGEAKQPAAENPAAEP